MSNLRKIDRMHERYGYKAESCGDCSNFVRYKYRGKNYKKCLRYGATHGASTDWNVSYLACGMFNTPKPENERCVIETARGKRAAEEPPEGQMTLC